MIKSIVSRLTMVKSPKEGFYDSIDRCKIYYWQDYYFDTYMASSRWGMRIKLN